MGRVTKRDLRRARKEDVLRLARWLKIRDIDKMSHNQLIRLLDWLFKRPLQRSRGMAWTW
jgi:hypothetical protein